MSTNELVEAFYEQHKEKYPQVSLEEMRVITLGPFEMFKRIMSSGEFEDVRLQYLFVARVSCSRVMKHLKSIHKARKDGRMKEETFDRYFNMLMEYVYKNPKKFKKYKKRIKDIIR